MRRYDPNDTATLRREVRAADDDLIDATVTFTLTLPDGTAATLGEVKRLSTGVYGVDPYPLTDYGLYSYTSLAAGDQVADPAHRGQFYVADDDDRLPPLASRDRLARKLGYLDGTFPSTEESVRADDMLNDASELIRDIANKTWANAETGALEAIPRRVVSICLASAARGFGNPEALTQRSIGDSLKSFDRSGLDGGEAIYLTEEEKKAIIRAAAGTASSMNVVTLVSPYNGTYLDDDDQVVWA